jgi:hypothetical protein
MGNGKEEQPIQDLPKVDDMTDEQLGKIITDSINLSELTLRGSVQMAEIPLEHEVTSGIISLVISVWRAKKIEDLYPFAKKVDGVENPGSRTLEVELDKDYLAATRSHLQPEKPREAVDRLKVKVVERLTPIEVPKLPPGLRSYPTTAMSVLVRRKQAERHTITPSSFGGRL